MTASAEPVILLIDDNEDDVFFMTRAVKEAGLNWNLQVARDGREALAYLSRRPPLVDPTASPRPDLILLDLKLPYVPGLEVLQWLREQSALRRVIVIVLTSSQAPVDLNRAFQLGANSVMEKPATSSKIRELARVFRVGEKPAEAPFGSAG